MDVTAFYKGYHGDLNETFVVGEVDEESKDLIRVTAEASLTPEEPVMQKRCMLRMRAVC